MSKKIVLVLLALCLLCGCSKKQEEVPTESTAGTTTETTVKEPAETAPEATDEAIALEVIEGYADIAVKDLGTITVELKPDKAPKTVANFVKLAKSGFYDGLTFHRIMAGFMMQGGDPNGNGTGNSGETIPGEFSANGIENDLSHTRGVLSMARAQPFDSASCQFFIVHEDSTFLDGQYAAFGIVTEGMDIVDAICEAAQPIDGNGLIAKDAQPVIESITIREK